MDQLVKMGDHPMTERMTLSHLRARIRAGAYQDDLYALEERRLLFLRWLVWQGWVNEWQVTDEASEAGLPSLSGPAPDYSQA